MNTIEHMLPQQRPEPNETLLHKGQRADVYLGRATLGDIRSINQSKRREQDLLPQDLLPPLTITENEHLVKKGDSLGRIAQEHLGHHASAREIYALVKKLAELNNLQNPDQLRPGQILQFSQVDSKPRLQVEPPVVKPPQSGDNPVWSGDKSAQPESTAAVQSPADKPAYPVAAATAKPKEEAGISGFFHAVGAVMADVGKGCVDEITHHPLQVLENVAVGAGVAVAAALAAPEIVVAGAVAGIAVGGYELLNHGGQWINAAEVVAHAQGHSQAEVQAAHDQLHGVGEGLADLAAGALGGGAGTIGVKIGQKVIGDEVATAISGAGRFLGLGEKAEAVAGKGSAAERPIMEKQALEAPVVDSPHEMVRRYSVAGRDYGLSKANPDDVWFYGKCIDSVRDIGPVKIHVSVSGPEDLARVQRVLIPFLNDDAEVGNLAAAWKTFDPNQGFGRGVDKFTPAPLGQRSKGFTIYARNSADAQRLQVLIDRQLTAKGLALAEAIPSGNVDIIAGSSKRVGTVRDWFAATRGDGGLGVKLDDGLAERMEAEAGQSRLSVRQLKQVERQVGLEPGSLAYDRNGHLMLELHNIEERPRNGRLYADESRAGKIFGHLTDRPAIYALARQFGFDPAQFA